MRLSLSYGSVMFVMVAGMLVATATLGLPACSSSDGGAPSLLDGSGPGPTGEGGVDATGTDAPVDSADATPPKPSLVDVTNVNLMVAGDARLYVLSVPKTYDPARKYPLIVALHGDGQSADGFRTFLNLDDLSGNDAITAYTDGVIDLTTPYATNGDQQLVSATITDVSSKFNIDSTKIWGFGYSKGGFILNEMSCTKPGTFTAIAAHATGKPSLDASQCPGILALPVLVAGGDQDPEVGGDQAAAEYWAQVDGCGMTSTPINPNVCGSFDGCSSGKKVVYCLAPGVAHFPIWSQATTVTWAFFQSL